MRDKEVVICLAWYKREQWFQLRRLAVDGDTLGDTFDEWENMAQDAVQNFHTLEQQVYKVQVDVFELAKWCRKKGLPIDADARARFAAELGEDRSRRILL